MIKNFLKSTTLLTLTWVLSARTSLAADAAPMTTTPKITINVLGEKKFEGSVADLKKVVEPKTISLVEPQIEKQRSYRAFDFKALMKKLNADNWTQAKTLKITCTDGYNPVVVIANLKSGAPYLAFDTADKQPFSFMKEGKETQYGPLYLVWTQKMNTAQRKIHLTGGNWPYQIATLSFE